MTAAEKQSPDVEIDWDQAARSVDGTEVDPSDVYARVPPDSIPKKKDKRREKDKKAREPSVEMKTPIVDDDPQNPEDLADEAIAALDGMFALLASLRGYHLIKMPDGSLMIEHVMPDEKTRARTKKALVRAAKSAGVSMSPGMGLAFALFGGYGAPILGMEMARMSLKKAGA